MVVWKPVDNSNTLEDKQKEFKELCKEIDESMKHTLDILSEVFDRAWKLDFDSMPCPSCQIKSELTVNTEETPKKTVKKRAVKKAKTVEKTKDILTLNVDAPVAPHHSGDKGKGQIEFDTLE